MKANYAHLLSIANLPTLENRRDVMKLTIHSGWLMAFPTWCISL